MNILFYIDRYPGFGGIETVTTFLSNSFTQNGYTIFIVSHIQQNEELLENLDSQVTLLKLPSKELLSKENQSFLMNAIYVNKIDIIIHQHSYAPYFELLVAIKDKIKCSILIVEHNTPDAQIMMYQNHLKDGKYNRHWKFNLQKLFYALSIKKCKIKERKRHRYLYEYSDRYILLSERFVPVFKNVTKLTECKKLACIPNPNPLPNPKNSELTTKEKIILYVGRIDKPHKRVDRLVSIFEKLNKDFPDWKLVIVGDGAFKNELEHYVIEKGIANIFFEGFKSNATEYYKKATILCLTSNIEGWGMVLVEAMQYGVIPFSYNSYASVYDIIDDQKNGFIIPAFKEDNYVKQLKLVMRNEKLRQNISENAKVKVQDFSVQHIIEKWDKIFKEEINKSILKI